MKNTPALVQVNEKAAEPGRGGAEEEGAEGEEHVAREEEVQGGLSGKAYTTNMTRDNGRF